jgi:hypothetical protein
MKTFITSTVLFFILQVPAIGLSYCSTSIDSIRTDVDLKIQGEASDTLLLNDFEIDSIKKEIINSRLPFYLIPSRFNHPYVPFKKYQASLIMNFNRNIRFDMAMTDQLGFGVGFDNILLFTSDYRVARIFGYYALPISDRIHYFIGSEFELAEKHTGVLKIHNSINYHSEWILGSAQMSYLLKNGELMQEYEIGGSVALKLSHRMHIKSDVKYIPNFISDNLTVPWRSSPWDFEIGLRIHSRRTSVGFAVVNTGLEYNSVILTFAVPIYGWKKMPNYNYISSTGDKELHKGTVPKRNRSFLEDLLFH